ncbi:hypothetical protein KFK09_001752 [Dendrobium nobile]|uniref:Uncharacterized protein n=1 Tax=Dendrobium nobile TaxID=94219 RepID=A0A8T3CBS3_DENNO|nr:hypothetical protein KFK09_001752 [Dendrobium nobile]
MGAREYVAISMMRRLSRDGSSREVLEVESNVDCQDNGNRERLLQELSDLDARMEVLGGSEVEEFLEEVNAFARSLKRYVGVSEATGSIAQGVLAEGSTQVGMLNMEDNVMVTSSNCNEPVLKHGSSRPVKDSDEIRDAWKKSMPVTLSLYDDVRSFLREDGMVKLDLNKARGNIQKLDRALVGHKAEVCKETCVQSRQLDKKDKEMQNLLGSAEAGVKKDSGLVHSGIVKPNAEASSSHDSYSALDTDQGEWTIVTRRRRLINSRAGVKEVGEKPIDEGIGLMGTKKNEHIDLSIQPKHSVVQIVDCAQSSQPLVQQEVDEVLGNLQSKEKLVTSSGNEDEVRCSSAQELTGLMRWTNNPPAQPLIGRILKLSDSNAGILKHKNKQDINVKSRFSKELALMSPLQNLPRVRRSKDKNDLVSSLSEQFVNEIDKTDGMKGIDIDLGGVKKKTGNYLRHLIGENDISFIGLLENKMESFSRKDIDKLVGRDWDKNKLKLLKQLKDEQDKEIKILQELECLPDGLSEVQTEALRFKLHMLNGTVARIMTWWRQRAKVRWIEEGDGNAHFFHSMASAKRRINGSNSMKQTDGTVVTMHREILNVIHGFFEQKWHEQSIVVDGWPSFEAQRTWLAPFAEILDGEVTKKEIWAVVSSFDRNIAPGRDGVTTSFFKFFLEIVGEQVLRTCLEFFAGGIMETTWKETVDIEQAYDKMSWNTLELVLRRVPICGGGPPISHHLYADDILIFAGASILTVRKITSILENYCSWTGQRVNRSKSAIIFSKRTSFTTWSRLEKITGCRKVEEMDYLGIKLALRRLMKKDFTPLLQQARAKTLSWGFRHLSLEDRVILINVVLLPSSVYLVTHMLVPKSVLNDVERVCRSFLWDLDANHKSIYYIVWRSVAKPRRKGGLGFHASSD